MALLLLSTFSRLTFVDPVRLTALGLFYSSRCPLDLFSFTHDTISYLFLSLSLFKNSTWLSGLSQSWAPRFKPPLPSSQSSECLGLDVSGQQGILLNFLLYVFMYLFICLFMCVHVIAWVWRSENNLQEVVFSFHPCVLGIKQRLADGSKRLSCWTRVLNHTLSFKGQISVFVRVTSYNLLTRPMDNCDSLPWLL